MFPTTWLPQNPTRKTRVRSGPLKRATTNARPHLTLLEDRAVPSFGWAVGAEGGSGKAVAADSAGNAYMAGSFSGSYTPAGSSVPLTSAGGSDIFVAKYSRSGAFQWAVSLGGAGNDSGNGIAVDGAGDVYVVGQLNGGYVAQLNAATGAVNWTRTVSGDAADAVAADGANAAYVTSHQGSYSGPTYVTKFNAGGAQQWQDFITTSSAYVFGTIASVAVTGTSVYVGGTDIGGGTLTIGPHNYAIPNGSGYVLKLTNDNAFSWARAFRGVAGGGYIVNNRVAVDSAGNVYAGGEFTGKVNFTGANQTKGAGVLNATNYAQFVTKLTPSGSLAWAAQFGSFPVDFSTTTIAVDGAGAVYLTGLNAVSKFNTSGALQWTISLGGTGICVDSFGDIYVTGSVGPGTTDFDPGHTYGDNRDLVTTANGGSFLWQILQP